MVHPKNYSKIDQVLAVLTPIVSGLGAEFKTKSGETFYGSVVQILPGGDEIPGMETMVLDWKVLGMNTERMTGETDLYTLLLEQMPDSEIDRIFSIFTKEDYRAPEYEPEFIDEERANRRLPPITSIRIEADGTIGFYMYWGYAQEEANWLKNKGGEYTFDDPLCQQVLEMMEELNPLTFLGGPEMPTYPYERLKWTRDIKGILEQLKTQKFSRMILQNLGANNKGNRSLYPGGNVETHIEIIFEK